MLGKRYLDRVDWLNGVSGLGRGAVWNTLNGLRPGHDAGKVRIFVRVEGTSIRTIRLPLLTALGLFLLPLLPKNFFLPLFGSVFRARSHAWATNVAYDRRRNHHDRRRRRRRHRRRSRDHRRHRRRRSRHDRRRRRHRRPYARAPR